MTYLFDWNLKIYVSYTKLQQAEEINKREKFENVKLCIIKREIENTLSCQFRFSLVGARNCDNLRRKGNVSYAKP